MRRDAPPRRRARAGAADARPALAAVVHANAAAAVVVFILAKVLIWAWLVTLRGVDPVLSVERWKIPVLFGMDVAVACGLWLVGMFLADLTRSRPLLRVYWAGAAVISVLGVVASNRLVELYGAPLTWEHLKQVGDVRVAWGSLVFALDVGTWIQLLGLLLLWAVVYAVLSRRPWLQRSPPAMPFAVVGLSLVLAGAAFVATEGLHTYGLKDNALVRILRTREGYKTVPDLDAMVADARARLRPGDADTPVARSLAGPARLPAAGTDVAGVGASSSLVIVLLESTSAARATAGPMPILDRLRAEGLDFTRHYGVKPRSDVSAYSIFFGEYRDWPGAFELQDLFPDAPPGRSLLQTAREAGWRTGVFQAGHLSYQDFGFIWSAGGEEIVGAEALTAAGAPAWRWGAHEPATVDAALAWIASLPAGERFVVVYRPVLPHHPYFVPGEALRGADAAERYDRSLTHVDTQVERLIEGAQRQSRGDVSVLILADHGETVSGRHSGHGLAVSDEELRVPCVLWHPGLPGRSAVTTQTSHVDVAPTVAALMGWPAEPTWRGRNLLQDEVDSRVSYMMRDNGGRTAVVDLPWVFVNAPGEQEDVLLRVGEDGQMAPAEHAGPVTATAWLELLDGFERHALLHSLSDVVAPKDEGRAVASPGAQAGPAAAPAAEAAAAP